MSESKLKIQATSGAEIRTKVQDTPRRAWLRLLATPPALCSSTSSFKQDREEVQTFPLTNSLLPLLARSGTDLQLVPRLDVVACQELEQLIHKDDRDGHLKDHHPLGPGQWPDLEDHLWGGERPRQYTS